MKFLLSLQNVLIGVSVALLAFIPIASFFINVRSVFGGPLFMASFFSVFLVMIVRPLADIFNEQTRIRRLVILRKGFGIFSASIIVGFMIAAIIAPHSVYLRSLLTADYYALYNYALFAHLGDISGLILLVTSNTLSQRLLKRNWKRIQRLSYVYFYAGGIYEAFALESTFALYALFVVTNLTVLAYVAKALRDNSSTKTVTNA